MEETTKTPESGATVKPEFMALAAKLDTAPCFIADAMGISPEKMEKLLIKRGLYKDDGDESIAECIERVYGNEILGDCMALIGVCPFVAKEKTQGDAK